MSSSSWEEVDSSAYKRKIRLFAVETMTGPDYHVTRLRHGLKKWRHRKVEDVCVMDNNVTAEVDALTAPSLLLPIVAKTITVGNGAEVFARTFRWRGSS